MKSTLLKDQVYERLCAAFISGHYAPGSRLPPEPDLCQELGVSRGTLRQALSRLAAEGLIERRSRHGTLVLHCQRAKAKKVLFISQASHDFGYFHPYLYIFPGVLQACQKLGIELDHFEKLMISPSTLPGLARRIISQEYMGVICSASNFLGHELLLQLLRSCTLPVVLAHAWDADLEVTGLPVIATDQRASFAAGLQHLAAFGHRRVATAWMDESSRRGYSKNQYARLLKSLGLDPEPELQISLPLNNAEITEKRLSKLFKSGGNPPSALMCYSDHIAMQCYPALKKLGVSIPQELAVMGYCGQAGRNLLEPPLSTVDVGYDRIGRMALELLLQADQWFQKKSPPPLLYSPFSIDSLASTDFIIWNNLLGANKKEKLCSKEPSRHLAV